MRAILVPILFMVLFAIPAPDIDAQSFRRGDATGDGMLDTADAIATFATLFSGLPASCLDANDVNDDGTLDLGDGVYLLYYLYLSGEPPPPPFPGCGTDVVIDLLDCVTSSVSCNPPAQSAPLFPGESYPVTDPKRLTIGDWNGDGHVDLAAVSRLRDAVYVLLNDGYGVFENFPYDPDFAIPVGDQPRWIDRGDLDGDGDLDLVTADRGTSSVNGVSVLFNDGTGTFSPAQTYASGSRPLRVYVGEFDGTPFPDLLLLCDLPGSERLVLPGLGDGSFAAGVTTSLPDLTSSPGPWVIGDLDEDGIDDAVIHDQVGASIFLGVPGGGVLAAGVVTPVLDPYAGVLVDVDLDGHLDYVASGYEFGAYHLGICRGVGDGSFLPPQIVFIGEFLVDMRAADVDLDGRADLVCTTSDAGSGEDDLSVYLGTGAGLFSHWTSWRAGLSPSSLEVADLDQDGWPDIASSHDFMEGSLRIHRGIGDGRFSATVQFPTEEGPNSLRVADVDEDGTLDLVVVSNELLGAGSVVVYAGDGSGAFSESVAIPGLATPYGSGVADLNGDGRLDLATIQSGGLFSVWLGGAAGVFSALPPQPIGTHAIELEFADLDADGVLDCVIPLMGMHTVAVGLGVGNGTFTPFAAIPAGEDPQSVSMGDLDADGDLDIVAGSTDGIFGCNILWGAGDGTFSAPSPVLTFQRLWDVALADFDQDGDLDLVGVPGSDDDFLHFENQGLGTFTPLPAHPIGRSARLVIADVDGNGTADAVLSLEDRIGLLLGGGDGTFGAPRYFTHRRTPSGLAAADFDGDGDIDLVGISYLESELHYFEGRSVP